MQRLGFSGGDGLRRPPLSNVVCLGDSQTHGSAFVLGSMEPGGSASVANGHHPESRWSAKLSAAIGRPVANFGWDGAVTADFIGTGSHLRTKRLSAWRRVGARCVIVMLGLNESSLAEFEANTRELVGRIRGEGSIPIFLTNIAVDFAGGHYSWDRNPAIDSFDNVYRALAVELGIHLVDVNAAAKAEIAQGIWDHRWRADKETSNASLDLNQPEPWASDGVPGSWFTDIHVGPKGTDLYAETIAAYFGANGL